MNERDKELLYEAGGQYDGHNVLTDVERVDTENVDYKKFADLIRADEREACAVLAEKTIWAGELVAKAIRARGNT